MPGIKVSLSIISKKPAKPYFSELTNGKKVIFFATIFNYENLITIDWEKQGDCSG